MERTPVAGEADGWVVVRVVLVAVVVSNESTMITSPSPSNPRSFITSLPYH
jgi:hypothetical protein